MTNVPEVPRCGHCGGTAGQVSGGTHALCSAKAVNGLPTPSLGNRCPCCSGSGCHPRTSAGPLNPSQDTIERWAPACVLCRGCGAIAIEDVAAQAYRDEQAKRKKHWFSGCVTRSASRHQAPDCPACEAGMPIYAVTYLPTKSGHVVIQRSKTIKKAPWT